MQNIGVRREASNLMMKARNSSNIDEAELWCKKAAITSVGLEVSDENIIRLENHILEALRTGCLNEFYSQCRNYLNRNHSSELRKRRKFNHQ